MIERSGSRVYNSAVVLEHGQVAGVYRKTHLMPGETIFAEGDEYPVFEVKGLRYGINICYDTQFASAAARIAGQRARVLLVPAQNMMKRKAAEEWKHRHNQLRAERVRETGMWLVSADVTGERGDSHIGYGPTSVMNPSADVVAEVPLMETGMVIYSIPQGDASATSQSNPLTTDHCLRSSFGAASGTVRPAELMTLTDGLAALRVTGRWRGSRGVCRRPQVQQHRVGVLAAIDHPVTLRAVQRGGGVGAFHTEADVLNTALPGDVGQCAQQRTAHAVPSPVSNNADSQLWYVGAHEAVGRVSVGEEP